MQSLPIVDEGILVRFLVDLLKTPSPTGFAHEAIALIDKVLRKLVRSQYTKSAKGRAAGNHRRRKTRCSARINRSRRYIGGYG